MDTDEMRIGFVGAGQMGRPMVDRLVAAGYTTEVFARRPEARADLEAHGIMVATSAVELAARSDLLIVCLFSDSQLREVVLDGGVLAAMRPGSTFVSHVTGSPGLIEEIGSSAPGGVHVLDVPISGAADSIRVGRLTLLVGGDPADLERVRGPLGSYGDPIIGVGGLGDGQRMKLINNLLFTVQLRMALEAAALGESMGVPAAELSRVLSECSGDSFALRLFQGSAPESMKSSVTPYLSKDLAVVRDVAETMGIDLGLLGDLASWVDV